MAYVKNRFISKSGREHTCTRTFSGQNRYRKSIWLC